MADSNRNLELAKTLVEALKYKHTHKNARYYQGLNYDTFVYKYARRFLPPKFNQYFRLVEGQEEELNEKYTDYIVRHLEDPDLQAYLEPETVPEETDNFHEQVQRDAEESKEQEKKEKEEEKKAKEKGEQSFHLGEKEEEEKEEEAPKEALTPEQAADKLEKIKEETPPPEKPETPEQVADYLEAKKQSAPEAKPPSPIILPGQEQPPAEPVLKSTQQQKQEAVEWLAALETPKLEKKVPPPTEKTKPDLKTTLKEPAHPTPKFLVGAQAIDKKPTVKPLTNISRAERATDRVAEIKARVEQIRKPEPPKIILPASVEREMILEKPKPSIPHIPVPSPVKDAGNVTQISVKKLLAKVPFSVATVAVVGGAIGGAMAGPTGALVFGGGAAFIANKIRQDRLQSSGEGYVSDAVVEEPLSEPSPTPLRTAVQHAMDGDSPWMSSNRSYRNPLRRRRTPRKKAASTLEKQIASQIKQKVVMALMSQWWFWAIVVVVGLVGFIIFSNMPTMTSLCPYFQAKCGAGFGGGGAPNPNQNSTISIKKTGPDAVQNGQDIPYQITVTNNGSSAADIDITDPIPNNTEFVDASDLGGNVSGVITWHVTGIAPGASRTVTLTVKSLLDDVYITNQASATIAGGGGSGSGTNSGNSGTGGTNQGSNPGNNGGNTASNQNDCGGKYAADFKKETLGNYGDPNCDFNKSDLFQAFQQADPVNADFWFNVVVLGESSYDPNNFNPNAQDPAGAWGLTQMGRGLNGQYDHGDVSWQQQVTNSVNYQHQINSWTYWAAAISRW